MRQSGTVVEYVDKFAELVDQLTAYGHVTDPSYFAICFVDGLKDDVRILVALHRPTTFDTVAALALLQEEVADKRREFSKFDLAHSFKTQAKGPHPLPPPKQR